VHDDMISFRHNPFQLVFKRRRDALDQLEKSLATWLDMNAVLDVMGRSVAFIRTDD
jgi:hypothetical protein